MLFSLQPKVLSMYDWENPDKLMNGREIDLGKSLPKDSLSLKMIAEQLTLMEFSVYAVIQRRFVAFLSYGIVKTLFLLS